MQLKNVTLEMSLKPFYEVTDAFVEKVCREVFEQWLPLLRDAEMVSILLWTADGSEILTYKGNLDDEIEWARYIGGANPHWSVPGDPEGKAIHSRCYVYRENPAVITYRDLKRIIATLKRIGNQITGLPVRVGETFDPGCEFAKSPFKYSLHKEICLADTGGPKSFTCCYAEFNADKETYIGFPNGIPQGTPMGTFLGRQAQHLLTDMGFDYIWFSNGFGFGLETWMTRGPLFDGQKFETAQANEIRQKILDFWKLFRKECPKFRVETRGTNLSTGIDLASDGVPLREIYDGDFNMQPPPNSPWAALNGDFGLELAGYMSHIAELPGAKGYPFRFYTHDPWWHNSPWLDRYAREPHDIYMPMSVSRIDGQGNIENPSAILFLTIDDSHGKMPRQVPNEVIPHVQEGMRHAPDAPSPAVWVYPFDEYHELTFGKAPRTSEMFFADWFIRSAITNGFPLNTVVSTTNFVSSRKAKPKLYRESVLVTPVPEAGSELEGALRDHITSGGRVLFYGPVSHASDAWLKLVNLQKAQPLSGELAVELTMDVDELRQTPYPKKLIHRDVMCGGGYDASLASEPEQGTRVLARVSRGGDSRPAALVRTMPEWNGGSVAWVRGTNAGEYLGGDLISGRGHLPTADDASTIFYGDTLMRFALAALGPKFAVSKRRPEQANPITCIARNDNAFYFSGFTPDTTVEMALRFPQGIPIFFGAETEIVNGTGRYRMPRAWRRECRLFIEQADGTISCVERTAEMIGLKRRVRLTGLKDATVRFYPENNDREVVMTNNGSYPYFVGPFAAYDQVDDALGRHLRAEKVSGELVIHW